MLFRSLVSTSKNGQLTTALGQFIHAFEIEMDVKIIAGSTTRLLEYMKFQQICEAFFPCEKKHRPTVVSKMRNESVDENDFHFGNKFRTFSDPTDRSLLCLLSIFIEFPELNIPIQTYAINATYCRGGTQKTLR